MAWKLLPNKKFALSFGVVGFNEKDPSRYSVDLTTLMNYLASGMIKPVIARRIPLEEAQQAQEMILGAKVKGKIVLICGEGSR